MRTVVIMARMKGVSRCYGPQIDC